MGIVPHEPSIQHTCIIQPTELPGEELGHSEEELRGLGFVCMTPAAYALTLAQAIASLELESKGR